MIRVLVADDHGVVRAGLEQLLDNFDDLNVIGSAANGQEAVAISAAHRPDVVVMDLSMPVLDGIEATRQIVAAHPGTKVIVLTSFSDRARILEAVDAGASGYLLKDAEPEELLRGVRAASRGESPLAPKVARTVLAACVERRPGDELTEREREVLVMLSSGLLNKQIAGRLGISEKTVKAHLTNAYRRIGVEDRTQAALWAQRHRLEGRPQA